MALILRSRTNLLEYFHLVLAEAETVQYAHSASFTKALGTCCLYFVLYIIYTNAVSFLPAAPQVTCLDTLWIPIPYTTKLTMAVLVVEVMVDD